tara:strand:+ start:2014 stop:3603 length:1590 start_codon:yes stop_codon:yes gene_type:complete
LQPRQPAPADYYQNNLQHAFGFVLQRYADMLSAAHRRSLSQFLAASVDAQRLLARLLTRKGPYFLRATLNYGEISQVDAAIFELRQLGLISFDPGAADRLLKLYTKSELCECFNVPVVMRKTTKNLISEYLLSRYADRQIAKRLGAFGPWIRLREQGHWQLAQLLFFGNTNQDWSTFVRKDLGEIRYEALPLNQPQYTDADSLRDRLLAQNLHRLCYRLDEYPRLAAALYSALATALRRGTSEDLLQRCALRLGQWAERNSKVDLALCAYELTNKPPARERRARILQRLKRSEAAEALRQEILSAPLSAKEQVFAERFGRRGAGFQPPVTEMRIHGSYDSIEEYALTALIADGGWGLHCENALFKSLTGLLYWPVIFADVEDAFTNPFQSAPHDLSSEDFYDKRRTLITRHELRLNDDSAFAEFLQTTYDAKIGTANRLVNWSLFETVSIAQWLEAIPIIAIRRLCHFMIRNLADYRSGFPDLFICYGPATFEFVEVKGPNDQLQPQQRAWFRVLEELALPARVLKLRP